MVVMGLDAGGEGEFSQVVGGSGQLRFHIAEVEDGGHGLTPRLLPVGVTV